MRLLISSALTAIRLIAPWVVRTLATAIRLVVIAQITFWTNVGPMGKKIADEMLLRAVRAGFPQEYADELFQAILIAAVLMIVVGWVIQAFLIVWLVSVVLF